jgi:hypothetical protein
LIEHRKYIEVAVVDEDGVVAEQERIENEPGRIEEISKRLRNATIVLESSSSQSIRAMASKSRDLCLHLARTTAMF